MICRYYFHNNLLFVSEVGIQLPIQGKAPKFASQHLFVQGDVV